MFDFFLYDILEGSILKGMIVIVSESLFGRKHVQGECWIRSLF